MSTSTSTGRTFTIEYLIGLSDNALAADLCDTINAGPASVHALWHDLGATWAAEVEGGVVPAPPPAEDIAAALADDHALTEAGADASGWVRYLPPSP